MSGIRLRRLLPEPGELTVVDAVAGLDLGARAPRERPYLVCNMVASADGRAALQGRSGGLGNPADRELFHELRTAADAIMVGSGTLRTERYGRFVRDPERRARREAAGRAPDPIGCVVSRSLRVPFDIPLFDDPESTIVVYTSSEGELGPCAARVLVTRLPASELTLTSVLRRLRSDHGVRSVLCEGGPTILGALLAESLVDELFLSLAPKLAGGGSDLTTVEGPGLAEPVELEVAWALESQGCLFLRYMIDPLTRRAGGPPPGTL
ncbi:MAG: dihydrofolate reductase family protein [Actinomycetota bacterium]|nr:dihydrofolate reductase family protein [Actinomycetota bacterium]